MNTMFQAAANGSASGDDYFRPGKPVVVVPLPVRPEYSALLFFEYHRSLSLNSQPRQYIPNNRSGLHWNWSEASPLGQRFIYPVTHERSTTTSVSTLNVLYNPSKVSYEKLASPQITQVYKRFLPHELTVLKEAYKRCKYPDKKKKNEIASELSTTFIRIQNWFVNQRQRERAGALGFNPEFNAGAIKNAHQIDSQYSRTRTSVIKQ